MAPTRILTTQSKQTSTAVPVRKGVTTRNSAINNQLAKQPVILKETRIKRKAEASPPKDKNVKRSALGNITNAIGKSFAHVNEPKKLVKKTYPSHTSKTFNPNTNKASYSDNWSSIIGQNCC